MDTLPFYSGQIQRFWKYPLFSPIQKTTNSILLLVVIILLILPIHTFAGYTCGQGCVYQGNQVYHCENSAGAWAGCAAYMSAHPGGSCVQWNATSVKYSQALYQWYYPDPPLDCGEPDACSAKAGEAKEGTFQYPSDKICNLQFNSCQVACSTSEDLGNGQIITTGCTFTGSVASAQAPAEVCSLEQASGASPQDCASGRVISVSWDETYSRCTDGFIDDAVYFANNCLKDVLSGVFNGAGLGGLVNNGSGSGGSGTSYKPASGVNKWGFGGAALEGLLAGISCMVTDPIPQHNCSEDIFIRTSADCILRNNPTLDPNIYKDPVTGEGTPCPYPLIEDKNLGACVAVDYPLPTAQQMQDALEQGVTNPPRSEPCPPNTHEINGICFKDSDDTPYKDGTTLPQNEPATQGGDGYHVWADNQIILERLVSNMSDVLSQIQATGVVDSSTMIQQLGELQQVSEVLSDLKTKQCGGPGQPKCSVSDSELNQTLDSIKSTNDGIKSSLDQLSAKVSDLQNDFEEWFDADCTQQPWLMSMTIGGDFGLYECDVHDEEANEKLALIVEDVETVKQVMKDFEEKNTQAEQDSKTASLDKLQEIEQKRHQIADLIAAEIQKVESQAGTAITPSSSPSNSTDWMFGETDWVFGTTGGSVGEWQFVPTVSIPASTWFSMFMAILPIAILTDIPECRADQLAIDVNILGKNYNQLMYYNGVCDDFEPVRNVISWLISLFFVFGAYKLILETLDESQRLALQAMSVGGG